MNYEITLLCIHSMLEIMEKKLITKSNKYLSDFLFFKNFRGKKLFKGHMKLSSLLIPFLALKCLLLLLLL